MLLMLLLLALDHAISLLSQYGGLAKGWGVQLLCTWDCLARHSPKAIQVMLIGDSSVGHAAIARLLSHTVIAFAGLLIALCCCINRAKNMACIYAVHTGPGESRIQIADVAICCSICSLCCYVVDVRLHTEPCGGSGPYTNTNPLFHINVAALQ